MELAGDLQSLQLRTASPSATVKNLVFLQHEGKYVRKGGANTEANTP
jgi:hypothetical protein